MAMKWKTTGEIQAKYTCSFKTFIFINQLDFILILPLGDSHATVSQSRYSAFTRAVVLNICILVSGPNLRFILLLSNQSQTTLNKTIAFVCTSKLPITYIILYLTVLCYTMAAYRFVFTAFMNDCM